MVGLMEPDWSLNGSTNQPLGLTEWDKNKINKTVNLFIVSRVAQKQVERLDYLVDTVEDGKAALSALASVHYWVVLMTVKCGSWMVTPPPAKFGGAKALVGIQP